jgi:hypothetical protein
MMASLREGGLLVLVWSCVWRVGTQMEALQQLCGAPGDAALVRALRYVRGRYGRRTSTRAVWANEPEGAVRYVVVYIVVV